MKNHRMYVTCVVLCLALSSTAATAEGDRLSVCVFQKPDERLNRGLALADGIYSTSYHASYIGSEKCPDYWNHLRLQDQLQGDLAQKFRAAMADDRRTIGGKYYIQFAAEYHRYSKDEKNMYPGFSGVFEIHELKAFVEIKE